MRRRQLLLAAAVGGAGMLWGLRAKNSDNGGVHSAYFQTLSTALDNAGLARPTLIIDKQKLLANANILHQHLAGR